MASPLRIFRESKNSSQKIAMISLYDAPSAKLCCDNGADALLIGDSLGSVILGYDSTIPVTMEDMLRHTGAVVRGAQKSTRPEVPIIADLPFGSYADEASAVRNSVGLMQAGAHAVKLEGASTRALQAVEALVQTGAPVMGHLGFTPQSSLQLDGIVQGKSSDGAEALVLQAKRLEEAGCFSIVLEMVAMETAAEITNCISIPTIGIGAGAGCDGQVLVWHDLIGLSEHNYRFVKKFAQAHGALTQASRDYVQQVQAGKFPAPENGWERTP